MIDLYTYDIFISIYVYMYRRQRDQDWWIFSVKGQKVHILGFTDYTASAVITQLFIVVVKSYKQYVHKWAQLGSNKMLLTGSENRISWNFYVSQNILLLSII